MARTYSKESKKATQLALDTGCTAIYVRVSTELQANEGNSLAAQERQLKAFCVAQDWTICDEHIYVDAGVSGKSVDRPRFQAMLKAAQAGEIKRIVCMKLDRMARNVREFLATVDQLKSWDCALVLVKESFDTSTPHGRFALTMFAAMAELEASTITERLMTGKGQNAITGGFNGGRIPYGYSYSNGDFTINHDQANIVREIFTLFISGVSLNAIVRTLNENRIPTATGKGQWFVNGIKHLLGNGAYCGLGQWNGTESTTASYPPIVGRDAYDAAQQRLQSATRGQRLDLAG